MATTAVRAEWTSVKVTGSRQSITMDVKEMRHVEIQVDKKLMSQISNGASHLFVQINQNMRNGAGFTVAGDQAAFNDNSRNGAAIISGKTTGGPGTLVVIGKGSPIWKAIQRTNAVFLEIYSLGGSTSSDVTFYVAEEALVSTSQGNEVIAEGIDTIKFNVEIRKSQFGNHHFKFLVDSASKSATASIKAFGWKGNKKTGSRFNLTKYDKDKLGYVIDSTDPLYCNSGTCQYHLQVSLSNINKIEVYLGEHADLEHLRQNGHTIGYIKAESEKENFYSYDIDKTNTVVFTLVPIEGIAHLYVHPGFKPDLASQYYYKAEGSAAKRVVVGTRDLEGMKLHDQKLYVQVYCEHACRYVLKAHTVFDDVFTLHPGYTETGLLAQAELRQHLLVTKEFDGAKVERRLRIKLQTYSGQANLYVKNCQADTSCKIEDTDLQVNASSFVSNKEMKPYKEIVYNMYCAKTQPKLLPPNTLYSRSCAINVITEGVKSDQVGMIKYELSVEDEMDVHMLHMNHFSFIRLHPGQKKVYALSFSQPSAKAKALAFAIDGKYGNVTACLRVGKLDGDCWQSANVRADGLGFSEAYKRLIVNYSTHAGLIAGEYNLELKADEMGSGLLLGASEIFDSYDSARTAREIKAGLPLSDHLVNTTQVAYYTFELTKADYAQGIDVIVISLTPISGHFMVAVRNDDATPSMTDNQWFTMSNEIVIRKTDEFFKQNSRYMIAVIPKLEGDSNAEFRYQIKWSYLDKHDVMAPGITNFGTIPDEKKCFVAEIFPTYQSVMFLKGGHDSLDAFISLGNENHLPQGSNYEFKVSHDQSGVLITKEQILDKCKTVFELKKYCNAYVCLFGKTGSEFSLTFVSDNNPITLMDGKILEGPLPVGDQQLRFIYHPQKVKSFDIEEFSVKSSCRIAANIEEYHNTTGYVWPKPGEGINTGQASIIHVSREKLQHYANPVVLVTLSRGALAAPFTVQFNFDAKFGLEAGGELKELTEHKQRVALASQSMWNYFYFYNFHPHDDIVIGLDSLDGGDADMFVGRGKDSRPTEFNFLQRSTGYRSSYIDLSLDFIKGKGYKDLTGYYVVGVKANSDIRFALYWKHSKSSIIKTAFGEQHSTVIQPGGKAHVLLYNLFKGEVELVVNSHHQPLTVLWHAYQKANASVPEEFPTMEAYQKKFTIEEINPIALIGIKDDTLGACVSCKYLYTLVNPNPTEPIKIDFYFDLKNSELQLTPQVIQPSMRMFGALEAGQTRRYHLNVPALSKETMAEYYLEVHLLHGEGDLTAKMATTNNQFHNLFADKVATGFTKVPLKQLADNEQFNKVVGFQGISLTNVHFDLTCTSSCTYRLVLVRPEHFTELNMNEGREFFLENDKSVESFVYHATGKEKHFDLSFVIKHFTNQNLHSLGDDMLKERVRVWHVKDKSDLTKGASHTALKPLHSEVDGVNGKLHLAYPVVEGYYVVEVKGTEATGFTYRLEANSRVISTLLAGRQSVAIVPENATHRIFEFYPHQPGSVYAKVDRCFGDASFAVKELGADNEFTPVEIENQKYTSVLQATGSGKPVYLQATKSPNRATVANEFGYLDHTKNLSIFSVEMFGSRAWHHLDFEKLKPFNEEVFIDLKTSVPTIQFRPIWFKEGEGSNYQIRYFVAVSKDPEALEFYAGCDYSMMSRVLKPGYSKEEAVQIFTMPLDPPLHMELGPMRPFHVINLPLVSGHRYFALVFAQVTVKNTIDERSVGVSDSLRIKYARIEFEYRSFFYPIELLAATIGLIGLVVASCCVFNSKLTSLIKKQLRFKQVAESDVDTDLEEYFMRIKYDYDQISAGQRTNDASRIDSSTLDASFQDRSTTEANDTTHEIHESTAELRHDPQEIDAKEEKSVELV